MAKLVNLKIRNYRGIKSLDLDFESESLICLIGRGDSGKTTILEAISSVLSPSWNLAFHDTDFYNCDTNTSIEIKASLIEFSEKLLSDDKYGLYVKSYNRETGIIKEEVLNSEVTDSEFDTSTIPLLTVRLTVDSNLEPKWEVVSGRTLENKPISGSDRALLNCFMVSDYVDRHFSWNKGNPLYSILNASSSDEKSDASNIVLESLREAKKQIDNHAYDNLTETTQVVIEQASSLGLDLSNTKTTLDFRDIAIKDGRVSLHDENIPFRLKGKGSKRLASLAIQSVLVKNGGIMLVDEIEQGLEPDRIKHLVRTLKTQNKGQIFLTTHSREVATELSVSNFLLLIRNKSGSEIISRLLHWNNDKLQGVIRACPEAFFARKVIVCEGATEIGICRALDTWRLKNNKNQMSFMDCAYVDGTGNNLTDRTEKIKECGFITALFCDSDDSTVNNSKIKLKNSGAEIFDCDTTYCIEKQVFFDLPWEGVKELIEYAIQTAKKGNEEDLKASVRSRYSDQKNFPEDWKDCDSNNMRQALAEASNVEDKSWFKQIQHGEKLGNIIFKYFNKIEDEKKLKSTLTALSDWIDEDGS